MGALSHETLQAICCWLQCEGTAAPHGRSPCLLSVYGHDSYASAVNHAATNFWSFAPLFVQDLSQLSDSVGLVFRKEVHQDYGELGRVNLPHVNTVTEGLRIVPSPLEFRLANKLGRS